MASHRPTGTQISTWKETPNIYLKRLQLSLKQKNEVKVFLAMFRNPLEQKVGNRMKIIFTCQVKKILKKMTSIRISDNVFMQTVFTHCNLLSILFSFHHSDLSSLVYKWICFLFSPVLIHYCIANSNSNFKTSYKFFPSLYRIKSQKSERGDFTKTPSNVCSCLEVLGVIVTAR